MLYSPVEVYWCFGGINYSKPSLIWINWEGEDIWIKWQSGLVKEKVALKDNT
jgi:hypothetical protein